jgi:hypothetical protein
MLSQYLKPLDKSKHSAMVLSHLALPFVARLPISPFRQLPQDAFRLDFTISHPVNSNVIKFSIAYSVQLIAIGL